VKVKVDVRLENLKRKVRDYMDDRTAKKIGDMLVSKSREFVAKGQSPVREVGRFPAYKDPIKYPGDLKPARPVNLELTGEYLSHLGYRRRGSTLEFGLMGMTGKIAKMAETHEKGLHDHVARRQIVPEPGQNFVASIATELRSLLRNRLLEIIKR
jgi:hypothetical protein